MSELASQREPIRWRPGVIAAIAMTLLALMPQLLLIAQRGRDWQGTYVSFDFDEVAYGSYLNALIDGRPRRNDPYTGLDDTPEQPIAESLHSIQFLPAYAAALPARALGLSAGTTLIVIRALAAFAATLTLFWLLLLLTSDARTAAAGAIVVLCLGGIAGEPHAAWRIITWRGTGDSLPFLRSYVPALVFPLFIAFIALIWRALQPSSSQSRQRTAWLAGLTFAILVFSYFFLWTSALAWLSIVAVFWLFSQGTARREAIRVFGIVGVCATVALLPYVMLLTRRAPTVDAAQLLTQTRPPIVSLPVVIGFVVLLALLIAVWRRRLSWRTPLVLFTASFALLPMVTFNQQLITGWLLQPVHYGRYSANYASVLAAFLTLTMIWQRTQSNEKKQRDIGRRMLVVAMIVLVWALVETEVRSARFSKHFRERDEAQRVAWRLRELANRSSVSTTTKEVVFCSDNLLADTLPTVAPQPVLWAPHLFVFSGASAAENRERLFQQLYYSGFGEDEFAAGVGNSSFLQLALFGWERMNQKTHVPGITSEDIQRETALYTDYVRALEGKQAAAQPLIDYVVVPATDGPSLKELDRWYLRDVGERVGDYMIYRTRLK